MRKRISAKERQRIEFWVMDQETWINIHGGTREGYVRRYGSKDDPEHYGSGGELIYDADYGELVRLRELIK